MTGVSTGGVVLALLAEVTYFDQRGELACPNVSEPCSTPQPYLDFRLERGNHGAWLITGIPSESR